MSKRANPHPHVAWRDGRPRFVPGAALRDLGYTGKDLRHDDGNWFTKGQAVDWSANFGKELKARMAAEKRAACAKPIASAAAGSTTARNRTFTRPSRPALYTLEHLFKEWTDPKVNPKFNKEIPRCYSHNTIRDYTSKKNVLLAFDPDLAASAVEALDKPILRGLFDELWANKGLATAKGTILVLSSAISWAILRGKVKLPSNPATQLKMETPDPRIRFATRKEIDALVKAADRIGRPEIGDMIVFAVWTGQRQSDRLAFTDKGLLNGRRYFRQLKTGAIVAIKQAPELEARLKQAAERRKKAGIVHPHVILDEKQKKPFNGYHYRHLFKDVRDAAVAGDIKNGVKPCKSLEDFWDLDLRDTSVTWQALAGATIPEIIAVSGHTMESATRILKHYLARHPEMADASIGKMISWYEGNGETETGL